MTGKQSSKKKSVIGNLLKANAALLRYLGGAGGGAKVGSECETGEVKEEHENENEKDDPLASAKKLNKISLIIFPAAFIFCNIAFWVVLYAHRVSKDL